MGRYTTITVRRNVLNMLEKIKEEVGASSLGEVIVLLIKFYREYKSLMFSREVEALRVKGLDDLKEAIAKVRRAKWARL